MRAECRALLPLRRERHAALQAIAEVESRLLRGRLLADNPYACAFFRCLNGSRRVSLADLRLFSPSLKAEALRGNRSQWLAAVDLLISSQGEHCCLPLPCDAAEHLFPAVRFRADERRRQKAELKVQRYSQQMARESETCRRAHQALKAQAEIDLAFHSPETAGSWLSRWSGYLEDYELESLLMRWSRRFPSLADLNVWPGDPLWRRVREVTLAGTVAPATVRALERWMVPNKLMMESLKS